MREIKSDSPFANTVIIWTSINFFWIPVIRRHVLLHTFGRLRFFKRIIGVSIFNVKKCGGYTETLSELRNLTG
jgi:hypothetical protein